MLAYQEWRTLNGEGKLNPVQKQFFLPKEAECLYDLEADPQETKNLAKDGQHQMILKELRQELSERVKSLPDLSFFPETVLVEQAVSRPLAFSKEHKQQMARLVEIADLSLLDWAEAEPRLKSALQSKDPWERYWAAIVCGTFGKTAAPLAGEVKSLLEDEQLLVRVRAAEFLGSIQAADPRPALLGVLRESDSPVTTLIALNAVVYLRDFCGYEFQIQPAAIRAKDSLVNRRLDYLLGKL
jgi:HEAT repeat protein